MRRILCSEILWLFFVEGSRIQEVVYWGVRQNITQVPLLKSSHMMSETHGGKRWISSRQNDRVRQQYIIVTYNHYAGSLSWEVCQLSLNSKCCLGIVCGMELLVVWNCWWYGIVGGMELLVVWNCWWYGIVGGMELLVVWTSCSVHLLYGMQMIRQRIGLYMFIRLQPSSWINSTQILIMHQTKCLYSCIIIKQ